MKSHEYARKLQATVDHLLSREEVDLKYRTPELYFHFWDKDEFVAMVRALGSGTKEVKDGDLHFRPEGTNLILTISRDKVCRKVQDEKWECEPLFSEEEISAL